MSGDYRRDFQDSGSTSLGTTVTRQDRETSLTAHGSRSGVRRHVAEPGPQRPQHQRGLQLSRHGRGQRRRPALGRYSGGGSALLLKTPEVSGTDYGFNVEGHPVAAAAPMRYRSACTTTCPSRGWSAATTAWT